MGMPVVTVAAGGMPVVEVATGGMPVDEATNGYGIPVTKVVGKPGMPVKYGAGGGGGGGTHAGSDLELRDSTSLLLLRDGVSTLQLGH